MIEMNAKTPRRQEMQRHYFRILILPWRLGVLAFITLFLLGCETKESATTQPAKLTLQLNWKPEPQFGGFYAAQVTNAFKKHELDVEIVPGGVGTPTVQMVAAGKVPFAVVSADEIVNIRSQGGDVVGIYAVFQTNPQGLMSHAARGFKSIDDVFKNEGTLAIQRGLPYAAFLEKKY